MDTSANYTLCRYKRCNMSTIKELRNQAKLTQQQVADIVGISLRSYKTYENDPAKEDTLKYNYILDKLKTITIVDEEHGILEIEDIREKCSEVFSKYPVHYCILFGSYAKGNPNEKSDLDFLISTDVTGLKFFGIIEELRETFNKKIELLTVSQLKDNLELTNEILKDGIRIYG
jgi:predicted nucleotidyltransferase